MKDIQLELLDVNNFVFQMVKIASSANYLYNNQIQSLIDYTKHYYETEALDEEIIEVFKRTIYNLNW